MTKAETSSVLTILKTAYPNFYRNMKQAEGEATLNLWTVMFAGDDVEIVKLALYRLIESHEGFPPDIATVKGKIRELVSYASGEPTYEELWYMLMKAISNGIYGAQEEYEKLPPVLQRYLGSPSAIRDMAMIDTDTLRTVNHGQFLKQIGTVRQRQEFDELTPPEIKAVLAGAYKPLGDKELLSDADYNDRRNNVLRQLE